MSEMLISMFIAYTAITSVVYAHQKVLLSDVQAITLRQGEYTTSRRGKPILQLRCVGGSNKCRYTPHTVQCINRGSDGTDVQWECKANLPANLQFGRLVVNCEGFHNPRDPYILAGSCGLDYTIDQSNSRSHFATPTRGRQKSGSNRFLWICIIFIAIWFLWKIFMSPHTGFRFWNSGGSDWWNGGDGSTRRTYGFPSSPQHSWFGNSDPDHCTGARQSSQSSGPGFLSGMALGAAGSYLFNRMHNNDSTQSRLYPHLHQSRQNASPMSFMSSAYDSDDTIESSGFATTSRR